MNTLNRDATAFDDELRLTRLHLMRALRAEGESRDVHGRIFEFADIVDELLGRIELLELARLWLRMTARLAANKIGDFQMTTETKGINHA